MMIWEMQKSRVVFVAPVSQTQCHFFFLVDIILVIHVSYYIAVYLNVVLYMVWTCVNGGDCESQYRKMLYFCYEIY